MNAAAIPIFFGGWGGGVGRGRSRGGRREGEGTLKNFVCYIAWAPASRVNPKKYTVYWD